MHDNDVNIVIQNGQTVFHRIAARLAARNDLRDLRDLLQLIALDAIPEREEAFGVPDENNTVDDRATLKDLQRVHREGLAAQIDQRFRKPGL